MNLDPIDGLLCDCLGRASDADLIASLNLLSIEEWESLRQRAIKQRIPALLYRRLKTLQPVQPFPDSILGKMRQMAINEAIFCIQQHHGFGKLLGTFRDNGIPVIVLKGAYLREVIYQDIGVRNMTDIDLMVQKTDLAPTMEMLHQLGYPSRFVSNNILEISNNEGFPLRKPGLPNVDIHWTIEQRGDLFKIDLTELWQRARNTSVAGVNVKVLAPKDFLLHLCLHSAFRHRFVIGLRNLCDIREICLHFDHVLDWQELLVRARQWNASRCLFLNLYFVQELLGVELPGKVMEQIEPGDFGPVIEQSILGRLFIENNRTKAMPVNLARAWSSHDINDKIAVFFRAAFPKPALLARLFSINPSKPRIFFYYPLRWLVLIRRWGRFIWRLIFHDKIAVTTFELNKKNVANDDWLANWLTTESGTVTKE